MSGQQARPVGFVGLGSIGEPMARRLVGWPGGLWVHDMVPAPVDRLRESGAQVGDSVADVVEHVGLLCVMVRDDDQVRQVLEEVLAAQPVDLTVAVHSTVGPATPRELAQRAQAGGVRLVDAPVSGGPMGAAQGTLAIMVGADDEAFERCREPFDQLATLVVHAGDVGAGTAMKLSRNLIHFVAFTAVTEAQRLAQEAGVDLETLGEVVRHTDAITGGPGAIMHRGTTAPLQPGEFWHGVFEHVRQLGEKDLRLATDLAQRLGVKTPLADLALERLGPGLGLSRDPKEQ